MGENLVKREGWHLESPCEEKVFGLLVDLRTWGVCAARGIVTAGAVHAPAHC